MAIGGRFAQIVLVASVLTGALVAAPSSQAKDCDPTLSSTPLPNPRTIQKTFTWNADFAERDITFRSRTCALLAATIYTPTNPVLADGERVPGVLVFPPSGGIAYRGNVGYIAKDLATHGYVAMTVDPQGIGDSSVLADPACTTEPGYSTPSPCPGVPFQQTDSWMEMARSALDLFLSDSLPELQHVDHDHIGTVGHSLGARVASYLQDPRYDQAGVDHSRIQATVGLDNISSNYYGDTSAGGGDTPANDAIVGQPIPGDEPITISVPGLGLASDNTTNSNPELKKAAYRAYCDAGQPSGMLVFKDVVHDDFSQGRTTDESKLHRFADDTLAWFDRWLKGDTTAVDRLLASTDFGGTPTRDLLSTTQHSAWCNLAPDFTEIPDYRATLG